MGQKTSEAAGQPVVIDNRGGAAGNIGSDNVAKSPGDGYTILQTVSALSLSPALYKKLPFDPVKDLTAVSQLTASPLIIVANAKTGISSLKDLIDRAKAKPGALNFGSGGVGNPQHLTMEMLKAAAGVDIVHIPFKGDAPLFTSLVAGDIELAVTPLSTALPHIQAGTLKALAVTGPKRGCSLPGRANRRRDLSRLRLDELAGLVRAGVDAERHRHEAQRLCAQRVANAGSARRTEDIRQRSGRQFAGTSSAPLQGRGRALHQDRERSQAASAGLAAARYSST